MEQLENHFFQLAKRNLLSHYQTNKIFFKQILIGRHNEAHTFSKRLIISFFKSFWGFSETGVSEGTSLNRSSIPDEDLLWLPASLDGAVFSAVDAFSAAVNAFSAAAD